MINYKGYKNKNDLRKRKTGAKKRRRILEHKKRLVALGVPETKITQLTPKQMHELLKYPKKTAAVYSAN